MKYLLFVTALSLPVFAFAQGEPHNAHPGDPLFDKKERVAQSTNGGIRIAKSVYGKDTTWTLVPNGDVMKDGVEGIPTFPGEFRSAINETQYYADHMQYPADAKAAKLTGVVKLTSVIDEKGNVTQVWVTQSLSPSTDAEAIRLVSQPKWTPATKEGQPAKVKWQHEVHFRL